LHFNKYGKTYQLRLETAADLEHILALDESLWVATSAPVGAFRCDPRLTALLDKDGTGRINTDEVRAAVKWLLGVLEDRTRLTEGADGIPLAAIRKGTPDGDALLRSAGYVLRGADEAGSESIALADVRAFLAELQQQPLNGDGVMVPEAASDPETVAFIKDVLSCMEGVEDASGKMGVTAQHLADFREAAAGFLEWKARGETSAAQDKSTVMPFGQDTPKLYDLTFAHADKVDLFFGLSRAVRFEPRAAARIGCPEADFRDFDFTKAEDIASCLARAPIAKPAGDAQLPLSGDDVNPLYASWLVDLAEIVLTAILGVPGESLSESDWEKVKSAFAPYAAYLGEKKGACVEKLPLDKLRSYLDGPLEKKAQEIIEADKKVADILDGVHELERLLLYHQDLVRFANNFVSFSQLYAVEERAFFETGSAVIDGRWFNLAVKVDDLKAHTAAAKDSNIFTLYLEVTGKGTESKFTVAVPATSGTKGNLVVGKRGVFFDTNGVEYDARVVQMIENPISLREALCAPFVRLWGFVVGKIEAMSGASEKELQKGADALMKAPPPSAAPAQGGVSKMAGGPAALLVGLSVSAAAIGTAFAFIAKTFSGMRLQQVLFGVGGAVLLVAIPVTLIAVLKLRRQDLSSLLEGCGWAINARMRLNRAQRRQFTRRVAYPKGATGTPKYRWVKMLAVVLLLILAISAICRVARRRQEARADAAPAPAAPASPAAQAEPAPAPPPAK